MASSICLFSSSIFSLQSLCCDVRSCCFDCKSSICDCIEITASFDFSICFDCSVNWICFLIISFNNVLFFSFSSAVALVDFSRSLCNLFIVSVALLVAFWNSSIDVFISFSLVLYAVFNLAISAFLSSIALELAVSKSVFSRFNLSISLCCSVDNVAFSSRISCILSSFSAIATAFILCSSIDAACKVFNSFLNWSASRCLSAILVFNIVTSSSRAFNSLVRAFNSKSVNSSFPVKLFMSSPIFLFSSITLPSSASLVSNLFINIVFWVVILSISSSIFFCSSLLKATVFSARPLAVFNSFILFSTAKEYSFIAVVRFSILSFNLLILEGSDILLYI